MSRLIKSHQPCPCGSSSDAYSVYDDHGYCYSCSKWHPIEADVNNTSDNPITQSQDLPITQSSPSSPPEGFTYEFLAWRGVDRSTMEFFKCYSKIDSEGRPVAISFPYNPTAQKIRSLTEKKFFSIGEMSNATLFGKDRFPAGSARAITITEGELDALSVYQMLGARYPVVSIRSASSGARDCAAEREYLNSFEKIYLCLDNDAPGEKATKDIARLFDFNKVYHVKLSDYKDANGFLEAGKAEDFKRIWFNARRFLPEGIISSKTEFDKIIDDDHHKEGVAFPFPTLQDLTYGIRTGETYLFTAMEGIGKTEVLRAIEYHLLRATDANIGVIHLEENKARTLKGFAGYALEAPCHLPDSPVTNDDIKKALSDVMRRDERLHIYSHFGSDDPDVILDTIRFLATACDCKYIFFDHITMAVSGLGEDDERKALDYISTRLAMMVEELDFALIFVSHINDQGLTRGSRNISKIAGTWIQLDRDKLAATEEERNTTRMTIFKNRFGARTGPAGELYFDLNTFIIAEKDPRDIRLPPVNIT